MTWKHVRKALAAAGLAAIAYGTKAYVGGFSPDEIGTMIGDGVAAFIVTYFIPNQTSDKKETADELDTAA
jgi:hypothetical protein